MARGSRVGLLLAGLALAGCPARPEFDLELYPGAMKKRVDPNIVAKEGTLFLHGEVTLDPPAQVAEHFRRTLVKGRGWTESHPKEEFTVFTDGNMEVNSAYDYSGPRPRDPSRPGGTVVLVDQGRVEVRVFRYVPVPAP